MTASADLVCRACTGHGAPGDIVLDLGDQPVAQYTDPAQVPTAPLTAWRCPHCLLVQSVRTPEDETGEQPGVEPQALLDQAADAVARLAHDGWLPSRGRVLEHPSPHGGSWLGLLADRGLTITGEGLADVVIDSFGLMHAADQRAALARRAADLAPGGVALLQFQTLASIVDQGQWSALRHGHHAYYSTRALTGLLAQHGLVAVHGYRFDLYGGTVLLVVRHAGQGVRPDASVASLIDAEAIADDLDAIKALQHAVTRTSDALRAYLRARRTEGRRVLGYGAASRAVVTLNGAGITAELLPAIGDASPGKQGHPLPGTDIAVISPDELLAADADEVLVLLPQLIPELLRQWPHLAGRLISVDPNDAGIIGSADDHVDGHTRSIAWQDRLHQLVPGGAHTQARGPDQYPEFRPVVFTRGRGALVWDADNHCYVEYGIGLRAVTLGHAHPRVDAAVSRALRDGVNFSRPTMLEAEVAEQFLVNVSHHDRVKFAKNGSDVTTAAVKLARAATRRTTIAVCQQSFFSVDDWWISHSAMDAGIPPEVAAQTQLFTYGDVTSLTEVLDRHEVAAVVLQAASATEQPPPGYLEAVRQLCDQRGVVLVFDEVITGFRWHAGGVQALTGVRPDLACWAKGMGNGYAISALTGRCELMDLGSLSTDAARPFLLSTTYGPEVVGLAATRAVLHEYRTSDPCSAMAEAGRALATAANQAIEAAGLARHLRVTGHPAALMFQTKDADGRPSQALRTVFLQGLMAHGVVGQSFVTSAAHGTEEIAHTVGAVEAALPDFRRALDEGWQTVLDGRPVAPALRRFAAPRERHL